MSQGFRWCYEDFCRFYELLTLPIGLPARLEGFQRLILRTIFQGDENERQWMPGASQARELTEALVLIPKGQAKTTLMAALAVYHLLVTPNAQCFVGAADKIQASELYRTAAHFIQSEPELDALAKVLGGTLEIRSRRDQGFIRVLASDDSRQGGKRQGFNPTLALIDELHAHENDSLYTDMRSGLFKRNGLLVTITTAGWDMHGALGALRASFLSADESGGSVKRSLTADELGRMVRDIDRGRLTYATKASGRAVMLEWACRDDDNVDDMEVVKLANPASWVTVQSLEDARESLTPWNFLRYRANRWTLAYESWIPEGAWDALYDSAVPVVEHRTWEGATGAELGAYVDSLYPEGAEVVGFIDMGRYRDTAALDLFGMIGNTLVCRSIIWRTGGPDSPIRYEWTKAAWLHIHEQYTLLAGGYDPKYYDQAAEELIEAGLPMEVWPQSNERMCPAAANLRHAILTDKSFRHDGDPILRAHVMAATAKDVGPDQFKLVKSSANGPPIDGCVALACALELWGMDSRSMYEDDEFGM